MEPTVVSDDRIVNAMIVLGGSFVSALGSVYRLADTENQRRLKAAFPEYFKEYEELARLGLLR